MLGRTSARTARLRQRRTPQGQSSAPQTTCSFTAAPELATESSGVQTVDHTEVPGRLAGTDGVRAGGTRRRSTPEPDAQEGPLSARVGTSVQASRHRPVCRPAGSRRRPAERGCRRAVPGRPSAVRCTCRGVSSGGGRLSATEVGPSRKAAANPADTPPLPDSSGPRNRRSITSVSTMPPSPSNRSPASAPFDHPARRASRRSHAEPSP